MAQDPAIVRAALRWRGDLERLDAAAARTLTGVYGDAWRSTRLELDRVVARIAAAQDAGEQLSPAWLYQQRRLDNTLAALADGMARFADHADATITATQTAAARLGADMAAQTATQATEATLGVAAGFETPPVESLRALAGHLADGTPLRPVLDSLGDTAARALTDTLAAGIARGLSPRQMIAEARDALAGDLHRALTIARTETMRAHREAARQTWEATGIIRGWVWLCACDPRSCAMCWAMHGREFPIGEPMGTHPNCRCTQVPIAPSWEQLGLRTGTPPANLGPRPGTPEFEALRPREREKFRRRQRAAAANPTPDLPAPLALQPGADRFDRLTALERRRILGPGRADLYESGDAHLLDFVDARHSDAWGTTRRASSLRDARGRAKARAVGTDVDDDTFRLGPGRLPQPDEVEIRRARRALESDRATARLVDQAAALGVTPDELAAARPLVEEYRRAVRQAAELAADDLFETIDQIWDARHVARPARSIVRRNARGGATVERQSVGEYDWLEQLAGDPAEMRRLRRWMDDDPWQRNGPDQIALQMSHALRRELTTDEAMGIWVDATRTHDALRSLQSGRLPSYYQGDLNALVPDVTGDGLDVGALFGDPDEAAGHVARWLADQETDAAYRTLRSVDYIEGPPPWRLDEFTYHDELVDTEQILREAADGGRRDVAAEHRWAELVPDGDAWGPDGTPFPPGELWARYRRLADRAGLDDTGTATGAA